MEDFDKIEFGKRLKEDIKLKFGSIKELAEMLGIDPSTISNYTRGQREPRAKFLGMLAKHGSDINWLLTGEKYKTEPSSDNLVKEKMELHQIYELQTRLEEITKRLEQLEKDRDQQN